MKPRIAQLDIRVLDELEDVLALDLAPSPSVIMPLTWRQEAQEGWPRPEPDDRLEDDIAKALDGEWLYLEEIAAIQRLRGWNRAQCGTILVDTGRLLAVSRVLGNLSMSLDSECDDQLRQLDYEGVEGDVRAAVTAQLAADGTCGECQWCTVRRLWAECDKAIDRTGLERGVYYRTTTLGQSVQQANYEVHGFRLNGYEPEERAR